ncbi:hypothetical protein ACTXT7_006623 [Hymenolepis weldensis]
MICSVIQDLVLTDLNCFPTKKRISSEFGVYEFALDSHSRAYAAQPCRPINRFGQHSVQSL